MKDSLVKSQEPHCWQVNPEWAQDEIEELGLFSLILGKEELAMNCRYSLLPDSSTRHLLDEYSAWQAWSEDACEANKLALPKEDRAQRIFCAQEQRLPSDYNLSPQSLKTFNIALREVFRQSLQEKHPRLRAYYFSDLLFFYLSQSWSKSPIVLKYDFSVTRLQQMVDLLADQQKAKNILEIFSLLYALHEAQDFLLEIQEIKLEDATRSKRQINIVAQQLKTGLESLFPEPEIFTLLQKNFPNYDFFVAEKPTVSESISKRFARRRRQ